MKMLFDFMAENPWTSCFLALVLASISAAVLTIIFRMFNRILRTINILFRGWPPGHLDADGDFNSYDEDEETKDVESEA